MTTRRKKKGLVKDIGKGVGKGLGKLAKGGTLSVVGELASILSLGLFKPPRRWK